MADIVVVAVELVVRIGWLAAGLPGYSLAGTAFVAAAVVLDIAGSGFGRIFGS